MHKTSVWLSLLILVTGLGSTAFATSYPPLAAKDASFDFYSAVADVQPRLLADGTIEWSLDYSFKGVTGRVVGVRDAKAPNPLDLVVLVNNALFYVPVGYTTIDKTLSFRRRWDDDPGIFIIIRGYRRSASGKRVRTAGQLKIATTSGKTLPSVIYSEVEYPLPPDADVD